MNAKQIARLMKYTTDVSTAHIPEQHRVADGYTWTYEGWPCWGIEQGRLAHDAVYDMTDYVDLEYVDATKLRVFKEKKHW